jgi:cyclic-di-AMP phosphodiesterase PgpH
VGINAGLLLLAYPFLLLFERGFGVTTDLTLLELSDTNRPLLKELSTRAPGTFNHAIQVANLAEAAADAIGANALQARVGALYHDIGKMIRPEYFIENQQPGENPHDRITPYMSALIIAEHVKAGEELGREHNLPEAVLSFIPTHHGTTLMEYFYRKAKEEGGEAAVVDESEFRYPGPRPQTNEHGIVMLADSVEAASRSLDKPTPKRIEGLIDVIFKARIEDGQLAQTALTFSDLDRIRETFLSILNGVYHFRVKYPGQDGGDAAPEGEPAPPVPAAPPGGPAPGDPQAGDPRGARPGLRGGPPRRALGRGTGHARVGRPPLAEGSRPRVGEGYRRRAALAASRAVRSRTGVRRTPGGRGGGGGAAGGPGRCRRGGPPARGAPPAAPARHRRGGRGRGR